MLSRTSSDAGHRLGRSKSTSTVHRHPPSAPEPLDPDVAQQHALAAATTAFVRAHANDAAVRYQNRSLELSRTKSNASRKSLGTQGSHFPPRELSFRSIQPQKGVKMQSVPRQVRAQAVATEKFPPLYVPPSADTTASLSSPVFNENMRPSSQPKPHRPSASSSIASQQIRKARSMYYASSIQTGSPIARPPAKYLTAPPSAMPAPGGFQAQMHPFPASSPLATPKLPVVVEPGETVDKARDKYLQQFSQRQVRPKPSLFLAPFKKRQYKAKVKVRPVSSGGISVQSNGADNYTDVILSDFKPQKDKEKRSLSNSLKDKFKKVFRRASNNSTLPVQQVEARRDYFGEYALPVNPPSNMQGSFEILSPDDKTMEKFRSRTPSIDGIRPPVARPASRGSNRSLCSEAEGSNASTSRATSWNSSATGIVLSQREVKRMTIIHEAKDSIGSQGDNHVVPVPPNRKTPPIPSFAAFREPMAMESLAEESMTPIDPKRVFSALVREIDASKATQSQSLQAPITPEDVSDVFQSRTSRVPRSNVSQELHPSASMEFRLGTGGHNHRASNYKHPDGVAAPSKASSIRSITHALKSTIRTVTPDHSSPDIPDRSTSVRGIVRIPRPDTASSNTTTGSRAQSVEWKDTTTGTINFKMHHENQNQTCRDSRVAQMVTPTPEQIESRVQKSKGRWKTPLEENHIPFFPRSVKRTFSVNGFRKTFAYKPSKEQVNEEPQKHAGAVSQATEAEQNEIIEPLVAGHDLKASFPTPPPKSPNPGPILSPLSPSVYSRNTDGMSIHPTDSAISLAGTTGDGTPGGTPVITASHFVTNSGIGTSMPKRDTQTMRSNQDWKAWLSHEVSELGKLQQEHIGIDEQCSAAEGHQRKFSQTTDDIEAVTPSSRTPTSRVEPIFPSRGKSQDVPSASSMETPTSTDDPKSQDYEPRTSRKIPLNRQPRERIASIPSDRSSLCRPRGGTPNSERMNDRFPFIETGRQSSTNSTRLSIQSSSTPDTGSGSSSLNTPSQKMYSDFSVPHSHRTSKYKLNAYSRKGQGPVPDHDKENRKGNTTPSSYKSLGVPTVPQTMARPRSLQPLAVSNANRSSTSVVQSPIHSENLRNKRTSARASTPSRPRLRPINTSLNKLTMRPKSAFDLRGVGMNTPNNATFPSILNPGIPCAGPYNMPQKQPRAQVLQDSHAQVKKNANNGRAIESDPLLALHQSAWTTEVPMGHSSPSFQSSPLMKGRSGARRRLLRDVETSSSTLALNKEPSPGPAERDIYSVLVKEDEPEDWARIRRALTPELRTQGSTGGLRTPDVLVPMRVESRASRRGYEAKDPIRRGGDGRITPGRKMAERFLRERLSGSGAGTPVSDEDGEETKRGDMVLEERFTPAFL